MCIYKDIKKEIFTDLPENVSKSLSLTICC